MIISYKKLGGSLYTTSQPRRKTERRMLSDRGCILCQCCRKAGGSYLDSVHRDVYER